MQFFSPTLCEDQPARVWKRKRDFTSRFIGGPGCGYGDFMRFRDVLSLVYHVKVMKNIDDKIHVFCTAIPVISNGTADVTLGVLLNWWDLWLLTPGDAECFGWSFDQLLVCGKLGSCHLIAGILYLLFWLAKYRFFRSLWCRIVSDQYHYLAEGNFWRHLYMRDSADVFGKLRGFCFSNVFNDYIHVFFKILSEHWQCKKGPVI